MYVWSINAAVEEEKTKRWNLWMNESGSGNLSMDMRHNLIKYHVNYVKSNVFPGVIIIREMIGHL